MKLRPVEHVVLRREEFESRNPLTWMPTRTTIEGRLSALVICDNGHKLSLHENHGIADDGKVTPSIGCMRSDCGWHVHAWLEGWPHRQA